MEATRWLRRETFREAVFRWINPLVAAFISCGCASRSADIAASLSPDAIASSTLRTKLRMRDRGILFIAVRRAIFRAAFLADGVLAIELCSYLSALAGFASL
jgi:hypothetical protein